MFDRRSREEFLTADGEAVYFLVSDVLEGLRQTPRNYKFVPNEEFERLVREQVAEAMQVYWIEILYRLTWPQRPA